MSYSVSLIFLRIERMHPGTVGTYQSYNNHALYLQSAYRRPDIRIINKGIITASNHYFQAYFICLGPLSPTVPNFLQNKKIPERPFYKGFREIKKSARRGSNPRPPPWQGGAPPLSHSRIYINIVVRLLIQPIWFR